MGRVNTGVTIDEDILNRNDRIREALKEQDPFARDIDRSQLVDQLLDEWNEENAHVFDDS